MTRRLLVGGESHGRTIAIADPVKYPQIVLPRRREPWDWNDAPPMSSLEMRTEIYVVRKFAFGRSEKFLWVYVAHPESFASDIDALTFDAVNNLIQNGDQ